MISSLSYTTVKLSKNIVQHKKSAERLKESELQKDLILNNTLEKFAFYDRDLKIIWTNKSSADSVGMTQEEIVGRQCYDVWHHRKVPCEGCIALKSKETKQPQIGSISTSDGKIWSVRCYPIFDEHGEVVNLIELGMDVTAERQTELKFETYVKNSPTPIFIANSKGEYTFSNPAASKLLGYTADELFSMNIKDIAHPDEYERSTHAFPQLLEGKHVRREISLLHKDGHKVYVILDAIMLDATNIIAFCTDVTERKLAEEKIEKQNEELAALNRNLEIFLNQTSDFIYFKDINSRFIFCSQTLADITGNENWKDMIGKHDSEVFPQDIAAIYSKEEEPVFNEGISLLNKVNPYYRVNEETGYVETNKWPIFDDKNSVVGIFGISRDITERKRTEDKLRKALKEKDFLMKELNHRVKNNLLMVSSLINLKDSETEADLSDIQQQVEAIGLIHEKLYQTGNVTEVCIRDSFDDLLNSIFSSFSRRPVKVEANIDDVYIPTKTAVPLGLVVNEIAINAIKHGFNEKETAVFSIKMDKDKVKNQYDLTLSNTGDPFPEEINIDNTDTLGLRLISALVAQIDGTIELQRDPHPVFTIRFPVEDE